MVEQVTGFQLMEQLVGTKVSFKWFGLKKGLTADEKAQVATTFGADAAQLKMDKLLISTKNKYYKKLTSLRNQVKKYWREITLPWVDDGVRLLRKEDMAKFTESMNEYQGSLVEASLDFGANFDSVLNEASEKLKDLYHRSDYPLTGYNLFELGYDWPNLLPPPYLDGELYERAMKQRAAEFEEALGLAERQFAEQLAKMVETLADRLKPNPDGTPKTFHASSIVNFQDFFVRFKNLNFREGSELQGLVEKAQELVGDVDPVVVRVDKKLKERLSEGMDSLIAQLDVCPLTAHRKRVVERPVLEVPVGNEPLIPDPVMNGPGSTVILDPVDVLVNEGGKSVEAVE